MKSFANLMIHSLDLLTQQPLPVLTGVFDYDFANKTKAKKPHSTRVLKGNSVERENKRKAKDPRLTSSWVILKKSFLDGLNYSRR